MEAEYGYHALLADPQMNMNPIVENVTQLKPGKRLDDQEYSRLIGDLNRGQHMYLMNMLDLIKSEQSFYHFISGVAGTGKSRLIKAIDQSVNRYIDRAEHADDDDDDNDDNNSDEEPSEEATAADENNIDVLLNSAGEYVVVDRKGVVEEQDEHIQVLLTSFTGKAAFNVRGTTLHTAFHLPITKESSDSLKKMTDKTCKAAREQYKKLRLLIIDEISMVGSNLFAKVDARLRQIFKKKDVPFGGLPVIVLGDFNQLSPVGDRWIFACPSNPYPFLTCQTNQQWQQFKLFELTEIMRQRDDLAFARALTTLGTHGLIGLSAAEIALFDSRIVDDPNLIPQDAMYLFFQNKHVDEHNRTKIGSMPGELFINTAQDKAQGCTASERADANRFLLSLKKTKRKDTNQMPYELYLKRNAKYMITSNIDINDGLVNGSNGTLREIVKDSETNSYAVLLWFHFPDPDIGRALRNKYNRKHPDPIPGIDRLNWTPMPAQQMTFRIRKTCRWRVERTQYQLVECEAITVHKSQGQTILAVAYNLIQNLQKQFLYVALTRVQRLDDLYLYGKKSIVENCDFLRHNKKTREQMVREAARTNKVLIEMNRLRREAPLINIYPFLLNDHHQSINQSQTINVNQYHADNAISLVYHRVERLENHLPFIATDFGFTRADIIILTECWTMPQQQVYFNTIPNYTLVRLTGSASITNPNGMALYLRNGARQALEYQFIADNSRQKHYTDQVVEISLFAIKQNQERLFICYLINYPGHSKQVLADALRLFFLQNLHQKYKNIVLEKLCLVGHFDYDPNTSDDSFHQFFAQHFALHPAPSAHNSPNATNWCLINFAQTEIQNIPYETAFNDYQPTWLYFKR